MPFGVAAGIGAIGAIGAAGIGYYGTQQASKAQAGAANQSLDFQKQMYANTQANLSPYMTAGKDATASLARLYGFPGANGGNGSGAPDYSGFYNSPDYMFARDQGNAATTNLLSARGGLLSGGGLAALNSYGQGLASQQLGNYTNRLLGIANMGAGAAGGFGQITNSAAGQIGNTIGGLGQAQASGYLGGANALAGGAMGAANGFMMPWYMQQFANNSGNRSAYTQPTGAVGSYGWTNPDYSGGGGGFNPNAFAGANVTGTNLG